MQSEPEWTITEIEIREGFLSDLRLSLQPGLTCIIGPRGSGKSTLASAIRFAVSGLESASKQRLDLFKANLSRSVVTLRATKSDGNSFAIRREGRNPPILTTSDGRALSAVDLDRGTFLPLDAYSAGEIEDIANEELGPRRRNLLDQLKPTEHRQILDQIASARRDLDANADLIRSLDREIASFYEQVQTLADARDRLIAMGKPAEANPETEALQNSARQEQFNANELSSLVAALEGLEQLSAKTEDLLAASRRLLQQPTANPASQNADILGKVDMRRLSLQRAIEAALQTVVREIQGTSTEILTEKEVLSARQLQQAALYAKLKEANETAGTAAKERAEAEQAVAKLTTLEESIKQAEAKRNEVTAQRRALRAKYITIGDALSDLRCKVAETLQQDAGTRVRIALRRSADRTEYILRLTDGLKGAGVGRHESIVETVSRLRPDELGQLISSRNYAEFEAATNLEGERAHKVLDAFRQALDPFELEVLRPDDMVTIELNVGKDAELFRDAAKLSQGQKCTALLPLLLARRSVPLVIDQPEDNLDNHFIFETVVQSLRRMKSKRQMIFVTHNANIPVLAEADLIVVLGSDGLNGRIERIGSVDECREEIIDILEGGEEAFDLRRKRYGRG